MCVAYQKRKKKLKIKQKLKVLVDVDHIKPIGKMKYKATR